MFTVLQLIDYTIFELRFEAHPSPSEASTLEPEPLAAELGLSHGLQTLPTLGEDGETGEVRLFVDVNPEEDWQDEHTFRAHIEIGGKFVWMDDELAFESDQDMARYYAVNSLSLLYGVTRVKIDDMVKDSPYSRSLLPAMSFKELVEENVDKEEIDGLLVRSGFREEEREKDSETEEEAE